MNITVLTALEREKQAVAKALAPIKHHQITVQAVAIAAVAWKPDETTQLIIMTGLAGGLDPKIPPAAVIVDSASTWPPTHNLPTGNFLTLEHTVETPQEKAELFTQTGAAIVEMESAKIRQWAKSKKIPYLGIRAVSDTATESLPHDVLQIVNPLGQPNVPQTLKAILKRPTILKDFKRLAKTSNQALHALGQTLHTLLTSS